MRHRLRSGSTLVEVVVAIVILTVGVLVMLGTSVAVDRLIVRGRRVTQAAQLGEQVLDSLRQKANDELPACSGVVSDLVGYSRQSVTVSWNVGALTATADLFERQLQVYLAYAADRRALVDTITTLLKCDA